MIIVCKKKQKEYQTKDMYIEITIIIKTHLDYDCWPLRFSSSNEIVVDDGTGLIMDVVFFTWFVVDNYENEIIAFGVMSGV